MYQEVIMADPKILRISGVALILALLLLVVPAAPALAFYDLALSPTQGTVGTSISVTGINFPVSTNTTTYTVILYFSSQQMAAGQSLESVIKKKTVAMPNTSSTGTFTTSFLIPAKFDDNSNVVQGTHYLYACMSGTPNTIQNYTLFTVISAALDPLSPTSGPAGTSVVVSGSNFPVSTLLVFKIDTTTISPASGDTATRTTGLFLSTITIPAGTAVGARTLSVTVGTATATATFTVTASAALDPLSPASGPAGTQVTITGSSFPASTVLVFKFDTTTRTPISGDGATRSSGIFITTITIPATATAGVHTITVTAGTTTLSRTFTVTVTATLDPLSPTSGPAGTDVTVSGTDFPTSTDIEFYFDATPITPKSGSTQTDTDGSFISVITVPSGAAVGTSTIEVTVGSSTISADFTVTAPTPTTPPSFTGTLSINANGDAVGSSFVVYGNGFHPSGIVTIKYDDAAVATYTTDASGYFISVPLSVPASKHGVHTITATDNIYSISANFTVESVAPQIPQPLSPANRQVLKSPLKFDWADVTDVSSPITYTLQIASASGFAADAIILEKTALTASEYTLPEAEGLKLTGEVKTYYWREKAIDAAMNESGWTGAGEFSVAQPFKFTGWVLYVTIGVGAVLVFLFGLWIGRRTAFYY
jgi:hypothetical protein